MKTHFWEYLFWFNGFVTLGRLFFECFGEWSPPSRLDYAITLVTVSALFFGNALELRTKSMADECLDYGKTLTLRLKRERLKK